VQFVPGKSSSPIWTLHSWNGKVSFQTQTHSKSAVLGGQKMQRSARARISHQWSLSLCVACLNSVFKVDTTRTQNQSVNLKRPRAIFWIRGKSKIHFDLYIWWTKLKVLVQSAKMGYDPVTCTFSAGAAFQNLTQVWHFLSHFSRSPFKGTFGPRFCLSWRISGTCQICFQYWTWLLAFCLQLVVIHKWKSPIISKLCFYLVKESRVWKAGR